VTAEDNKCASATRSEEPNCSQGKLNEWRLVVRRQVDQAVKLSESDDRNGDRQHPCEAEKQVVVTIRKVGHAASFVRQFN
jgi:hypothetical protein